MNLLCTDFEIFAVPLQFAQDSAVLDERWRQLQRQAHPDRFSLAHEQAQRQAMQWSSRINEAYQRLKDPIKRAAYLCQLHGVAVEAQSNTAMPADFLMQQMQWREDLQAASTAPALEQLAQDVAQTRRNMLEVLARAADEQRNFAAVAQQVRALMFVERFARDVRIRLGQFDEPAPG